MEREELLKELRNALDSVDITFPFRYVFVEAIEALQQPSLPEGLEEAAIDAAQLDMQDRQIMEDSNEHRMLYSRIFRRGFKAGAEWRDAQNPKLPDNLEEEATASMPKPNGIESNTDFSFFQMVWMFEQGAKWMAGQIRKKED